MAGQLVQRGERTWLVRVYMGRHPETGKRKHHNKTIHGRKKDAQAYLTKILRERDTGTFSEPSNRTIGEYMDEWLEAAARPRVKARTLRDYQDKVRCYIKPELGDVRLSRLTPLQIQALYAKMMAPKPDGGELSARSVRYTHAVLRSALGQAVKWRMIPTNPAVAVDLPRQGRTEMQALTPEQANRFLEVAGSFPGDPRVIEQNGRDPRAGQPNRWYALWLVLITAGLRPGEALGLKWKDLDGDTLRVRRALVNRPGMEWRLEEPKTKRSTRTVPLTADTARALAAHRVKQAEEKLSAGPDYEDNGLIFANETGAPCQLPNLTRRHFKKLLKVAGLPPIRLYDLRHTAASLWGAAGVPIKVVSEWLGHSSIVLTADTYSHVFPAMHADALDKVEAMLSAAK